MHPGSRSLALIVTNHLYFSVPGADPVTLLLGLEVDNFPFIPGMSLSPVTVFFEALNRHLRPELLKTSGFYTCYVLILMLSPTFSILSPLLSGECGSRLLSQPFIIYILFITL